MKLLLHKSTKRHIDGIIANPGGSFLFHGPSQMGKYLAAREVARMINCLGCKDDTCKSCLMLKVDTHPDVEILQPDDKNKIGIEAVQRMIQKLKYSSYERSNNRVIIIKNADKLTLPAQNSLLKALEEPPIKTSFLLTATSPASLLETIVSRCQAIYFGPLSTEELMNLDGLKNVPQKEAKIKIEAGARKPGEIMANLNRNDADESLLLAEHMVSTNDLFAKLKISTTISKHPDRISRFVDVIESLSKRQARTLDNPNNVIAVERLRRRLSSNISPKSAIEAFAVETAC